MKKLLFSVVISLFSTYSGAQNNAIQPLRYNDDNFALKADTSDLNFYRQFKLISLGRSHLKNNISFGGEVRLQYQGINGINFGNLPVGRSQEENYFSQRFMIHADFSFGNHFRVFSQLTSNHVQNKEDITPEIDKDALGLLQAFFDLKLGLGAEYVLRLGRQELLYGTENIIGSREGPNVRQSYDGLKLSLEKQSFTCDFFMVRPVIMKQGIFDDRRDLQELNIGTYGRYMANSNSTFNFYLIRSMRDDVFYYNISGAERRNSLGIAYNSQKDILAYSGELTYQFGRVGGETIKAFQQFAAVASRLKQFWLQPTIGIEEYVISGDKRQNDNTNNTFRAISAKPPCGTYFSFGASNTIILQPAISIKPLRKVSVKAKYVSVWRYSLNDAIYSSSMKSILYAGKTLSHVDLGKLYARGLEASLDYHLNKHFNINLLANQISSNEGTRMRNFSFKGTYKF